jgi:hypothetical protein
MIFIWQFEPTNFWSGGCCGGHWAAVLQPVLWQFPERRFPETKG